jgi:hypothetical protein
MNLLTRLRRRSSDIHIDPDYSNRKGYDAEFLGSDGCSVPLPTLPAELAAPAPRERPRPS